MQEARKAYSNVRRQQIIQAACISFSRGGFHKTTMQDIADAANLSPGALYRYFRSKEEIIEACSRESQQRNEAFFDRAKKEEGTLAVLGNLLDSFFGVFDTPGVLEALPLDLEMWAEAPRNPRIASLLSEGFTFIIEQIQAIIAESQRRGEINSALSPEAVAQVLVSCATGLELQKTIRRDVDHRAYLHAVKGLIEGRFWQAG